jgi:predicted DNA-binding transcriptional regulator AlpA
MRKQSSTSRHQEQETAVDDRYLSLRSLAMYSGMSVRTLRGYLVRRHAPLPHYRIGGKILVRRSEFDRWASEFKVVRSHVDLEPLVGDVVRGLG